MAEKITVEKKQNKKPKGLYEKISAIMKDVEYINKDDTVSYGTTRYKAMSEENVTKIYRQKFIEYGLVVFPIKQEVAVKEMYKQNNAGESVLVGFLTTTNTDYKLVDVDSGQYEIISSSGQGVDSQDKGVGKAMTYSFKYLFLRTFAAATGDDPDKISSPELDDIQQKIANKTERISRVIPPEHLENENLDVEELVQTRFPGAKVVETKTDRTKTLPALANDKDIIALRQQAETEGKLNLKIFDALVRSYTPANKETLIKIIKSKM